MNNCSAMIFDIKRFATHDGNGIRTTVFLKGCPLCCVWCQNPEGIHPKRQILYLSSKCIHCQTCVSLCKNQGMVYEQKQMKVHRDKQEDWDHLVMMCPTEALCYDSKEYTVDELVEEVMKDVAFFRYDGGVTFSGGEPLTHHAFLYEVLRRLKEKGIHTAIESSFYISREIVEKIVPYVDQIYCDLKLFSDSLHQQYTGVSNTIIKQNIQYLLQSEHRDKVIIRTPLIPQKSATFENISQIAQYLSSLYPNVKYELLNYNPLAKGKYDSLDMDYCFDNNPPLYSKEQMRVFYQIVEENGITYSIKEI